jgi:undecaprenyl-diphosphatase
VRAGPVQLDPVLDGVLLGSGVALAGVGEFLLPQLPPPWGPLAPPDLLTVNPLDRAAMAGRYSRAMDLASTVGEYSAFALPVAVALLADSKDALPLGAVYLESITLAMAAKNLVNYLVPRYRPYVYTGGAENVDPLEVDRSFPSGHTTFAFASATAGVFLFNAVSPNSPYLVPFAIVSYSLAAATATLRVTSGMHFVTDVVAGALIGSLFGALIPAVRTR